MFSKVISAISIIGFAQAYNEQLPCGTCLEEAHIFCYQGTIPQTQFNRVFNHPRELNQKCCKDARSCPEYLASQQAGKAQWICLNGGMTSNGVFGASSVPKADCPFITEYCGKQKDLTYAASTAVSS